MKTRRHGLKHAWSRSISLDPPNTLVLGCGKCDVQRRCLAKVREERAKIGGPL